MVHLGNFLVLPYGLGGNGFGNNGAGGLGNRYDVMYVYHMAKSDFFESSIISEQYLLQFVKDYLDDIDGYDGKALTRFYADCIGSGTPIMWEDMI